MKISRVGRVLKQSAIDFSSDECMGAGAAIAYYTIFSMPSILAIVFAVSTQFWSAEAVTGVMKSQLGLPLQKPVAQTPSSDISGESAGSDQTDDGFNLSTIAERASVENRPEHKWWAKLMGIGILFFSASGVLSQLQGAINKAWNVEPDESRGGIKSFIMKRILSLGMLVAIGFMLMVSLVVTTLLDEFTRWVHGGEPSGLLLSAMIVLNNLGS